VNNRDVENDLICLRRGLGIEEGEPCGFYSGGYYAKEVAWIFGPPLLVGIALLVIGWILAGFRRRT
jgi:hypothetical protein